MDKYTHISLLYDFYGGLLTEKQQEVLSLYHGDNCSLSEIAEELKISRQGVHATLKSGEAALMHYENKLMLVKKLAETQKAIGMLDQVIGKLKAKGEEEMESKLKQVRAVMDGSMT